MASFFGSLQNLSFYTIPAVWVVTMAPHSYAITQSKAFDNRSPRTYIGALAKDQTIDNATKNRIQRCEGAQTNGFESLGLFAAAVVAGNIAGLPAQTLNLLSGGYVLNRIVYNLIYITNTTEAMANLRSLVWLVGIGQIMTLFIKSGNVFKNRAANII